MQARGPLMIEHRLIERMISILEGVLEKIETQRDIDPVLIDTAVDFIRVYADQTHHGKEEDILFRDLEKKPLSEEDRRLMDELTTDHVLGRRKTKALVESNARYRNGETAALADIGANLRALIEFYPKHISKEDDIFFPAVRTYFSEKEEQAMLEEFWEFDREMIHRKFRAVVENLED